MTVEEYINLPYTVEMWRDSEEGWFVRIRELPGCMSQGDTAEEAVSMIREAMRLRLEVALDEGRAIPEPRPEEEYSGKFVVRVPQSLHRELVMTADRDGVSLNSTSMSSWPKQWDTARLPRERLPLPQGRLRSAVGQGVESPKIHPGAPWS